MKVFDALTGALRATFLTVITLLLMLLGLIVLTMAGPSAFGFPVGLYVGPLAMALLIGGLVLNHVLAARGIPMSAWRRAAVLFGGTAAGLTLLFVATLPSRIIARHRFWSIQVESGAALVIPRADTVYVTDYAQQQLIPLMQFSDPDGTAIDICAAALSEDGRMLAAATDDRLVVVKIDNAATVLLDRRLPVERPRSAVLGWAPTSARLCLAIVKGQQEAGLWTWDVGDDTLQRCNVADASPLTASPSWDPAGKRLAFTARDGDGSAVAIYDLETAEERLLWPGRWPGWLGKDTLAFLNAGRWLARDLGSNEADELDYAPQPGSPGPLTWSSNGLTFATSGIIEFWGMRSFCVHDRGGRKGRIFLDWPVGPPSPTGAAILELPRPLAVELGGEVQ